MRERASLRWTATVSLILIALAFPAVAKKKPPSHPVNLNAASAGELQLVPGIGPSTANKILEMRKSYGAFKSVDDLLAIKGMGPKKLDKMRKYLAVGKAPIAKPVTPSQAAAATKKSPSAKSPPTKAAVSKPAPVEPKTNEDEEP